MVTWADVNKPGNPAVMPSLAAPRASQSGSRIVAIGRQTGRL